MDSMIPALWLDIFGWTTPSEFLALANDPDDGFDLKEGIRENVVAANEVNDSQYDVDQTTQDIYVWLTENEWPND